MITLAKEKQLTIEDVSDNKSCRYPLGKVEEPPKYFCGKTRWGGYSYCEEHTKVCTKDESK